MADFGGQILFTYDGNSIIIRGKFDLEPGDFTYTVEHNQDGSFDRMVQPMGPVMDIDFVDSVDGISAESLDWNKIMAGGPYNIVVSETTNGNIHTIANGKFVGRTKVARLKGDATGMQIQGRVGSYKQLKA